jgi:gliding motility-associated lipoprotein GldH
MRNRPIATIVVIVLLMVCGCQRQIVFHQFQHISEPGWDKTDTLFFEISPLKTNGTYSLDAELRTDKDYPFQKLTIEVNQTIFPSHETYHDEIKCDLISEEGVIGGDGISYFQYRFHIRDISLCQGDSIHLSLTHNMKREIMPGIADMGIMVRRLESGYRTQ